MSTVRCKKCDEPVPTSFGAFVMDPDGVCELCILRDRISKLEYGLTVIGDEGYVSAHSHPNYLLALCDLQVDRAKATLDGKPLPSDECLDLPKLRYAPEHDSGPFRMANNDTLRYALHGVEVTKEVYEANISVNRLVCHCGEYLDEHTQLSGHDPVVMQPPDPEST